MIISILLWKENFVIFNFSVIYKTIIVDENSSTNITPLKSQILLPDIQINSIKGDNVVRKKVYDRLTNPNTYKKKVKT